MMREVRSIFYTPVAYVVMALLLALLGYTFQAVISYINKSPSDVTVLEVTFGNGLFFFIFAITTSLITMRTFSEEFRMGTIEMLTTAPVKEWQIVLAKFFGTVIFYAIALAPTLVFFIIFSMVSGGHPAAKGPGAFYSAYLMLLLISMLFIAIGNFASSLVKDQVNAAVLSISVKIIYLWVPMMLEELLNVTDPRVRAAAEFISPLMHMRDFSQGIVDTRRIVWYLSVTAFFLILTHHIFHSRKLKS
jgi:ABC-2 type transport system permease protein